MLGCQDSKKKIGLQLRGQCVCAKIRSQRRKESTMNHNTSTYNASNAALAAALASPFRNYHVVNEGIRQGLVKSRDMSKVTLHNEGRPATRPILRNHWAAYMSGDNQVTEFSFHVDGISLKVWEKDADGVAFVAVSENLGFDMALVWRRFEYDVRFGKARLSDDSSSFQRYFIENTNGGTVRLLARKDGIALMIKWLRRQERFITRQCQMLEDELSQVGAALGGQTSMVGYANYSDTNSEHVKEKRIARAGKIMQDAVFSALIRRGSSMPSDKVERVLEAPPTALLTKQSSLHKIEGGYSAGVGNKGQIDSYRVAPRNRKIEARAILADMAARQLARAEKAMNEGMFDEGERLFALAAETEAKANALNTAKDKKE